MANRNEIAKLYMRKKVYKIGKQLPEAEKANIEILPLSLEDMSLFNNDPNASLEDKSLQTIKLIAKSMELEVSDVKPMGIGFLEEVFDAILDANDLKDDEKMAGMKAAIKAKQGVV